MRRHSVAWVRPVAGVLALLVGLSFVVPAAASEDPISKPVAGKRSLAASAARAVQEMPRAALAQEPTTTTDTTTQSGFFKSTKGKVVLAAFLAGAGWAVYSAVDDRKAVKSPIRK